MYRLSIVTINYNNALGLEKTIASVATQTFRDFEYIIIDGGSTDASIETIKKFEHAIDYWVSEKDNGIYHAMNKGIAAAKGEYLLMLNSGDFFISDCVLNNLSVNRFNTDIVYADILWSGGGVISERSHPDKLSFQFFRTDFLSHQSTFIRRSLHQVIGLYDEGLKIVSDWKFMLLAVCRHNVSYIHYPQFAVQCDFNGMSNQQENRILAGVERRQTLQADFAAFMPDYIEFDRKSEELDLLNRQLYTRIDKRIRGIFKHNIEQ